MHELGLALELIDIASERARGARVRRLLVEVGALAAVLPDALQFCFEAASAGTALEGALLEIARKPARARCRRCSAEFELLRAFGRCSCGASELDWLSGDELRLCELEVG